ncbi:Zinc finger RING/FYVE/PHD-type protein [Dioscorea alata]|uniref:Zinc finger RING/FYVE/PHD-type protein n=1 Tax=Dioscorea alata TaxID=55571 RepID=A0ACB7WHS2_DIOAL|nr:Zinc finger RING/FYVE/PHD-type protein [Dioscorea alata]
MVMTSVPWRPVFVSAKPRALRQHAVRAFGRGDFEGFARRVASGEALKDAWKGANEGFETLAFESRRVAERLDRRFAISRRLDTAARAAAARARELDQELGIARRWRSFSVDFSRNWPRYRKELSNFLETPLGRGFATIFFLWFALSGWLFRFFILATWILPFAAPLLIGTFANSFAIEGSCPACKRRFVGYRNQIIRCTGCRNIVWQPGNDFSSRGGGSRPNPSDPDIIDIEIEEK